jgi:hypothetical protein
MLTENVVSEGNNMFFSEGEFIQFFCDFRRKIAIGFVANYPIEHRVSLSGRAEKLYIDLCLF